MIILNIRKFCELFLCDDKIAPTRFDTNQGSRRRSVQTEGLYIVVNYDKMCLQSGSETDPVFFPFFPTSLEKRGQHEKIFTKFVNYEDYAYLCVQDT